MRIDELLDVLDETLEESAGVPFSGGKRMVDIDRVRDIIDDMRMNLPTEIQQAKAVVQDRGSILATAKSDADALMKRAEERARALVAQEAVVKSAQAQAKEIVAQAQNLSRETRLKMTEYCEDLLATTEQQLTKAATDLKAVRQGMHKAQNTRRTR